ncbi:MAG TPA: DMT family transporter [Terriglobales bacterium]|nr:DMT family transporter [Terriglobales bacterium]
MTLKDSTSLSPRHNHPVRGYLFIAAATICWAISATLGRAAFTGKLFGSGQALAPIDPLILAQSRTTISFLVLAPILLAFRGRSALAMPRKDFLRVMLVGVVGVAASNYFYYLAIQRTNVATAIILQYTAPVWVLLYMVARGLQRASLQKIVSIGVALLGTALVIDVFTGDGLRTDRLGVTAAMLASLSFAFYNVFGGNVVQKHDRWKVVLYVFLGAAAFWAIVNPPWRIIAAHYSSQQWVFLFVFAVMSILLPFSFYFAGLQHLDPTRAIVTSCLEPVFSIIIAAVTLGEVLGPMQIIGMTLVLGATLIVQMPDRKGSAVIVEPME